MIRFVLVILGSALLGFCMAKVQAVAAVAQPGDWLSFAGAMLGASITIAGSVGVIEWQRHNDDRVRRRFLEQLMDDIEQECEPFQVANAAALQQRYGRSVRNQIDRLRTAIRRVRTLIEGTAPKTLAMLKACDELATINFDDPDIDQGMGAILMYPDSADLGQLNYLAHEVLGDVARARKALKSR